LPRIQYFKDLARRVEETPEEERSGKDWFALTREYQKLRRNFAGITEMERLPGAVFVVDPKREELLVKEANRLRIPVVALTDTNCDPDVIDYVVPGNDDAIRSITLISRLIGDAIVQAHGGEAIPSADRPLPPAVEEAEVSEEVSSEVSGEVSEGPAVEEAAANGRPEEPQGPGPEAGAPEAGALEAEEPQIADPGSAVDTAAAETAEPEAGPSAEVEQAHQEDSELEGAGEGPSVENEER
jgi:small subunit ribosomal protein S2